MLGLALLAGLLGLIGLWRFAASIPNAVASPELPTDAIIVLTG